MKGRQEVEGPQGASPGSAPRGDQESLQCARVTEEVDVAGGDKEKEEEDAVTLPQGRVLVLGDSQVRHLDRKRKLRVCLPLAGIGKVANRLNTCLENEMTKPIIFFQCGRE